jgi:hypothetical protein
MEWRRQGNGLPEPGEGLTMCYNCGCRMSSEAHDNPDNITDATFEKAGMAADESRDEAMRNTLELLQEKLGEKSS